MVAYHSWLRAICWGSEISIVSSGSILGVQNDSIIALSAFNTACLKVACRLCKAKIVKKIVVHVGGVPKLDYRSIGVCLWIGVLEIKGEGKCACCGNWAVVIEISSISCVVCLSEAVVSFGCGVGCYPVALPAVWGGTDFEGIDFDGSVSLGRVVDSPWAVGLLARFQK